MNLVLNLIRHTVTVKLYENGTTGSKFKQRKHRNVRRRPEDFKAYFLTIRYEIRLKTNNAIAFFKS